MIEKIWILSITRWGDIRPPFIVWELSTWTIIVTKSKSNAGADRKTSVEKSQAMINALN